MSIELETIFAAQSAKTAAIVVGTLVLSKAFNIAGSLLVNPHFLIQSQVRNVRSCSGVKGDV
jgi:hypothetical protein